MGNTPSQEPYEGDGPEDSTGAPEGSPLGRVVRAARGLFESVRSIVRWGNGGGRDAADGSGEGPTPEGELPAKPGSGVDGPDRSRTRPADRDDRPDLRSAREDGRLSIYHPDRPGASITSDTWERVEP